jgi:hypothetical protein
VIGIHLFYENWLTETFRKNESNRWTVCYTYKPANLFINMDWRLLLEIWHKGLNTHLGDFRKESLVLKWQDIGHLLKDFVN